MAIPDGALHHEDEVPPPCVRPTERTTGKNNATGLLVIKTGTCVGIPNSSLHHQDEVQPLCARPGERTNGKNNATILLAIKRALVQNHKKNA